jgi:hypothetical protein
VAKWLAKRKDTTWDLHQVKPLLTHGMSMATVRHPAPEGEKNKQNSFTVDLMFIKIGKTLTRLQSSPTSYIPRYTQICFRIVVL